MKSSHLACSLILALSSSAASLAQAQQEAQPDDNGTGIGLKAGTTGFGLELTRPLTDRLNVRLSYTALEYSDDLSSDDVDYEGDLKKRGAGVFADFHPWDGAFRLSAGLQHHFDNQIDVVGRASTTESFEFNGRFYDADDIGELHGSASFSDTTPYLGIGWGNAAHLSERGTGRVGVFVELGVLFQDSPEVSLRSTACQLPAGLCSQLAGDLRAEEAELEAEVEDFRLWPVLNIGLSWSF